MRACSDVDPRHRHHSGSAALAHAARDYVKDGGAGQDGQGEAGERHDYENRWIEHDETLADFDDRIADSDSSAMGSKRRSGLGVAVAHCHASTHRKSVTRLPSRSSVANSLVPKSVLSTPFFDTG